MESCPYVFHNRMTEYLEKFLNMFPLFKSLIMDNIVAIAVALFLLFMLWNGYRKGLMMKIISLGSVFITLLAEIRIYPAACQFLSENTKWQEVFRSLGKSLLFDRTSRQYSPLYELIGLDRLAENAGEMAGEVAIKVLLFVVLFALIRLLLKAAAMLIRGLRKIGVIRWADSWLGAVLGLAEGLIYVWLGMFLLAGMPDFVYTRFIMDQIMHSRFLFILYNENLITQFVAGMFS